MSKRNFTQKCKDLEGLGYSLTEYEPENKYAKYELNGSVKIIGVKK